MMPVVAHIDMDGVLCDWDGMIEKLGKRKIASVPVSEQRKFIETAMRMDPAFYRNLEPLPGAVEGFTRLAENPHIELFICSTPDWSFPQSFTDKRLWVEEHLGKAAKKRLILTHRKDLIIGDYLVDDRTANGAKAFNGTLIEFGKQISDWPRLVEFFEKLVNSMMLEEHG